VDFQRLLPLPKLFGRKLVAPACLIEADQAAPNRFHHRGFALRGPPNDARRQTDHHLSDWRRHLFPSPKSMLLRRDYTKLNASKA
jgi:hypothetical protein